MEPSAPQLSKLALHLYQIAVNSAAVERLFSCLSFHSIQNGNIQTKRRNSFVHDRVQKISKIKAMLPPMPRSEKAKAAGDQYLTQLSLRSAAQQAEAKAAQKAAEQKQATEDGARQYLECKESGPEDLIVSEEHVQEVVGEFLMQVEDRRHDAEDDDDEEYQSSGNRIYLHDMLLFEKLPQFDLNLLSELRPRG